jgi:hypothetical protein
LTLKVGAGLYLVAVKIGVDAIRRSSMSTPSRRLAGTLLIVLPTVVFGGVSILTLLINDPGYRDNALRQDLWRAGHAHAGVLLVLSLIALRYVDEATLSPRARAFARHAFPVSAILLPAGFFLSVLTPQATQPNPLIFLAYLGAAVLTAAMLVLGVDLVHRRQD